MRSRILLATLLALLLAAAPAAAQNGDPASLETAYEFDGALTPAVTEGSSAPLTFGPATFAEAGVDGVTRTVGVFGAEQPYRLDIGSLWSGEYAVAMLFRLDEVSGRRRILNVQGPSDPNALYVEDGRLVYELGATDVAGGAGRVAAGAWVQLVMVRRANDDVRIFADGVLDIAFTDTGNAATFISHGDTGFPGLAYRLRLFDGTGAEAATGQIARLRLFEDAMDDATAAGLTRLDAAAPSVAFPNVDVVEGRWWANRTTTFFGEIEDGGSSVRIESWLEDAEGAEVPDTRRVRPRPVTGQYAPGPERVMSYQSFGPYAMLEDGRQYTLVVTAEDASGNATGEQRFPITADVTAPAGLTIDGPGAQTSDRSPLVTGAATTGPRDDTTVFGVLCAGTTCDDVRRGFGGSPVIGDFQAAVAGGRWSAEVRMDDPDPDADEDSLVDLPNGTYTVQVWHCDHVSNCIFRERTFDVVDPQPAPKPSGGGGGTPQQQAPTAPVVVPQQPTAPRAAAPAPALPPAEVVAGQLARAAAQGLSAGRLKGLLRGAALALRPARPGSVSVQVYDAGRKVVLARGSGAGALRVRPTAKGRAKLRRARRLSVVVRTTFTPAGGKPVRVDRRVALKR